MWGCRDDCAVGIALLIKEYAGGGGGEDTGGGPTDEYWELAA